MAIYPQAPALAFFEFSSIARGLFLTDQAIKKAPIQVLVSQPVSSGKHILLFQGDIASVEESYRVVDTLSEGTLLKKTFIPGIHPDLQEFLESGWPPEVTNIPSAFDSIAIIESLHLSAAILAADKALKISPVQLCKLKLGQGIGGKAYFIISGGLDDIQASLAASEDILKSLESFVRSDLIPNPDREAMPFFSDVTANVVTL